LPSSSHPHSLLSSLSLAARKLKEKGKEEEWGVRKKRFVSDFHERNQTVEIKIAPPIKRVGRSKGFVSKEVK
jgi:hypothetical protein